MQLVQTFAGFYCSAEESAEYTADKIIIRLVWASIFIGSVILIRKNVKRTWAKAVLIAGIGVFSLIGWMVTEFMAIPWGC